MRGHMLKLIVAMAVLAGGLTACSSYPDAPLTLKPETEAANDYVIGAGDQLQVFVWRNQELTTSVRVRPDGKISVPLVEDLTVAGLTPKKAGKAISDSLSQYVKDAIVTVIMVDFVGPTSRNIRVVGEAAKPVEVPYRAGITALDVVVQAGGLTPFAAGNRATVLRSVDGKQETYRIRLGDLMNDGDVSANAQMAPGDILMIPQSRF